jgi:hypothetical protein
MRIDFQKINYDKDLNSRQQEAFNFQKVSAVLADFGFITIPLSNDWNGADFLAQDRDGKTFFKVQLKSRLTFDKKYFERDLYICFKDYESGYWYIYDHDELLRMVSPEGRIERTQTWIDNKPYHFPTLSKDLKELLRPYRIPTDNNDD